MPAKDLWEGSKDMCLMKSMCKDWNDGDSIPKDTRKHNEAALKKKETILKKPDALKRQVFNASGYG